MRPSTVSLSERVRPLFGPRDRTWINSAHQGPLPLAAVAAIERATALKTSPSALLDPAWFERVPRELREALGTLIGADPDDVILGNSTTHGLSLFFEGVDWRPGDEILLVEGDFPACAFPWLPLRDRGVELRFVRPERTRLEADALARGIGPRTRLLCTHWVHSLEGHQIDVQALSGVCRERGVLFLLNASQAIGALPFQVRDAGPDAVTSCGFKWLCGPYATGFSWIRPEVREGLRAPCGYWLSNMDTHGLEADVVYEQRPDLDARAFDVFCPANFLNHMPWTESVRLVTDLGVDAIAVHNAALVEHLVASLDQLGLDVRSPVAGEARTSLVLFACADGASTRACYEHVREAGIDVAFRNGAIRAAPHFFNTRDDIDELVDALTAFRRGN